MTKQQLIDLGLAEDVAEKVAAESATELKSFIPKHRFDEVNNEKKALKETVDANKTQLEELKKSAGDNEALTKQIETLQEDNKKKDEDYQEQLNTIKMDNAIKMAITGKVHDDDIVANMFDKSKLILQDDGKVTGLDDQLNSLKESKAFLFKSGEGNDQGNGNNSNNGNGFRVGGQGQAGGGTTGGNGETVSLADGVKSFFANAK